MELLAQVNWEEMGIYTVMVITLLGGRDVVGRIITVWQAKRASGNGDGAIKVCALHEEFASKLKERHEAVLGAIGEVKTSIRAVHERIDRIGK